MDTKDKTAAESTALVKILFILLLHPIYYESTTQGTYF